MAISPLLLGQYFASHRLQAIAASALIATVAMLFIALVWYALILWNSFMLKEKTGTQWVAVIWIWIIATLFVYFNITQGGGQ